jgi:hypothetical protein
MTNEEFQAWKDGRIHLQFLSEEGPEGLEDWRIWPQ